VFGHTTVSRRLIVSSISQSQADGQVEIIIQEVATTQKGKREINKKEGEKGVTSRPAELSKHVLKALITWKHTRARLRRGKGRNEMAIGQIVIDKVLML
jgi:hypothetical protein